MVPARLKDVVERNTAVVGRFLDIGQEDLLLCYELLVQSWPLVLSYLLSWALISALLFFFTGKAKTDGTATSTEVFAGVSLAQSFANVTCLSIFWGLATAVETMGSQLNGAEKYRELGLLVQRAIGILLVVCIPVVVIWQYAYDAFQSVGIDPVVCRIVHSSLTVRMVELPITIIAIPVNNFLQAINVTTPIIVSSISLIILFVVMCCVCVWGLELDFVSLLWCQVFSVYVSDIIMIILGLQHEKVMCIQ